MSCIDFDSQGKLEQQLNLPVLMQRLVRAPAIFFRVLIYAAAAVLLHSVCSLALAQSVQLSPEQEQMLNQLPPQQRQQAIRALTQVQGQTSNVNKPSSISEELSGISHVPSQSADSVANTESELRAEANSQLVINFELKEDISAAAGQSVENDPALSGLLGSRYYKLDSSGVLSFAGLSSISMIGLSAEQIELRLGAEPVLDVFDIAVSILESTPTGNDALDPYGYDVFGPSEYGFDPVTVGPVPPDYVLGPGDSLRVQLFGNVNGIYELEVSREGVLNLPELGPITVAGLTFSEFRADLSRRIQEMLIGTQISITMGQLRTIRIFVLGDAGRPGSYVVSSLATISSGLYAGGGISRVGSLRDIQLKRNGVLVTRLDLYDLLLNGDTSGDSRLQSGDVIFVPPVGAQVSVSGAVRRPAIYETTGGESVSDVLGMAGGLMAEAFPSGSRIERIDPKQDWSVLSIDISDPVETEKEVVAGDRLIIPSVLRNFSDTVTLSGEVLRPGPYQWRQGMRLTDLVSSGLDLKPGADSEYVLVRRLDPDMRQIQVVSANLRRALAERGSDQDIRLYPKDTVHILGLTLGRTRVIEPILEELAQQSRYGAPNRIVSVAGHVQSPGSYPLEVGMRVSDLIRAGGGLAEEAFTVTAELVRYSVVDDLYRVTEVLGIDLQSILRGNESADFTLREHDSLRVSGLPEWNSYWSVNLEGEVTFPGEYRIRRGETLREVLERAGGPTDAAFLEGAVFLRESLRQREQEQIEVLARRLEADINSLSLETLDSTGSETLTTGRALLAQLRETKAVGRLVVDIDGVQLGTMKSSLAANLELKDGDRILIPSVPQEVTVIGETQQNTSHLYQPGLSRDDYIRMSGGITRRADKKLIYVVRASGEVVTAGRSKWFGRTGSTDIRPGDTVVVPLQTDRIRPLTFWTGVTQILYQAAIAVAAVQTFDQ